jgi:hypothetical protein
VIPIEPRRLARFSALITALALAVPYLLEAVSGSADRRADISVLFAFLVALPCLLIVLALPASERGASLAAAATLFVGSVGLILFVALLGEDDGAWLVLRRVVCVLGQLGMIVGAIGYLRSRGRKAGRLAMVLGGVLLLLLLLLIVLPSLFRMNLSPAETESLSAIRTMMSGQAAFEGLTGSYGTPRCLAAPAQCIEGYSASDPVFLGADMLRPVRDGRLMTFHAEPAREPDSQVKEAFEGYAIVAVPLVPGEDSARTFCGDHTGRLCFYPEARVPRIHDARCPEDCLDLGG